MAQQPVQPLKVHKSGNSSPPKMDTRGALSDIGPMGIRRNSPSFHHQYGVASAQHSTAKLQSPYVLGEKKEDVPFRYQREQLSSPLSNFCGDSIDQQPSGTYADSRRSSLEKLQKACRVRNSNMILKDAVASTETTTSGRVSPSPPARRPMSNQPHTNTWSSSITGKEPGIDLKDLKTSKSGNLQFYNHPTTRFCKITPNQATWSDDEQLQPSDVQKRTPQGDSRCIKTVSFDAAPPQINEYEMVTPDLSSIASGSRESSYGPEDTGELGDVNRESYAEEHEDSFDESLEDIHKTPVEDPGTCTLSAYKPRDNGDVDATELNQTGTSEKIMESNSAGHYEPTDFMDETVRPLPPLPVSKSEQSSDAAGAFKSTTRAASLPQTPVSKFQPPRPASVSKAEILGMRDTPMPLGERLRLLELQDRQKASSKHQTHNQSRENRSLISDGARNDFLDDADGDKLHNKGALSKTVTGIPPKISRESILRDIEAESEPSQISRFDPEQQNISLLDPDIPVPSREMASDDVIDGAGSPIKLEDFESPLRSIYSYPLESTNSEPRSSAIREELHYDSSVIRYEDWEHSPSRSVSSTDNYRGPWSEKFRDKEADSQNGMAPEGRDQTQKDKRESLPELCSFLDNDDFGLSLIPYMSPSPPGSKQSDSRTTQFRDSKPSQSMNTESNEKSDITGHEEHPGSMTSSQASGLSGNQMAKPVLQAQEECIDDSREFIVPVKEATIKAPGTRLKTRPSLRPGDVFTSINNPREGRRLDVPDSGNVISNTELPGLVRGECTLDSGLKSETCENTRLAVPLDLKEGEVGLKLDEEFDRLMEAQHKGYLTRQNTKVVIASNREIDEEEAIGSCTITNCEKPVCPLVENEHVGKKENAVNFLSNAPSPSQTWTTEPWNGKMRRHSTRKSLFGQERRIDYKPVPPIPESQNNATTSIEKLEEGSLVTVTGEDEERGRLFVKVVGVKNLDLPLPQVDKSWFQLTLDNGLHCVTTTWLELGKAAPIGQEFELTVFTDLDFQLTLQTKLERPASQTSNPNATNLVKDAKTQKPSAFSRFLSSPKKKRELEKKKRADAQDAIRQKQRLSGDDLRTKNSSAWGLLHNLVGPDGSFARSYISLKDYESLAFGRPFSTSVPCYNEWAIEDHLAYATTHSKLGGIQRKPPYPIGMLDLQLLFVPKPRDIKDEDMPQSMSACVKQLKLAEEEALRPVAWEGFLSQQGGDCPYWRRRFFRLDGKNLISYHETTRQRRANINLTKATKLIDDRSALTQANTGSSKDARRRRKSAFAEEEEGYMFVEEGFRIRFSNGEIIDFYADNANDKSNWMKVLSEVIRKDSARKNITWTQLILAREGSEALKALQESPMKNATPDINGALATGKTRPQSMVSPAMAQNPSFDGTLTATNTNGNRKVVKSMIF